MKNFLKKNIKIVIAFILGIMVAVTITYAASIQSSNVSYDNSQSGIEADNVNEAINKLYDKANNIECKKGYTKQNETSSGYECVPPPSFATSSWDDIISAYNNNASWLEEDLENGTTRDVDLGSLGTHKLRIANLKKCSEVSVSSKTACGLVLEFADIITTHRMNPYSNSGNSNGDGNKGGWEYSDMRAYLNSGTYAAGSIDYSTSGILKSLPSDLQSKIIDTTVVSGHGSNDTKNFTTTDKLYLLSRREVWNDVGTIDTASGDEYTRQLDYYEKKGVTILKYASVIKQNNGSNAYWWLCSANSGNNSSFNVVRPNGRDNYNTSTYPFGVSPAFRLAN